MFLFKNILFAFIISIAIVSIVSSNISNTQAATDVPLASINPVLDKPTKPMESPIPTPIPKDAFTRVVVNNIPFDSTFVNYSDDNKYCSYVENGTVIIKKINDDKILHTIKETDAITYSLMLKDSNLIMYVYSDKKHNINIKTYNIGSKTTLSYPAIYTKSKIKLIKYSVNTNIVYLIAEDFNYGKTIDTIYKIDIMSHVTSHICYFKIDNIVPSYTSLKMYYQSNNTLYKMDFYTNNGKLIYSYNPVQLMKNEKVILIGNDRFDNYYLAKNDGSGSILVLNNDKIINMFNVNGEYKNFYDNGTGIYAIYKDYIINLLNTKLIKIKFDSKYDFSGIVGNTIYLRPIKPSSYHFQ